MDSFFLHPIKAKNTPKSRKPSFVRLCLTHGLAPQAYESIKDHSDSQAIGMVFYCFLWFSTLKSRIINMPDGLLWSLHSSMCGMHLHPV